jgi:hypothetical protein
MFVAGKTVLPGVTAGNPMPKSFRWPMPKNRKLIPAFAIATSRHFGL